MNSKNFVEYPSAVRHVSKLYSHMQAISSTQQICMAATMYFTYNDFLSESLIYQVLNFGGSGVEHHVVHVSNGIGHIYSDKTKAF